MELEGLGVCKMRKQIDKPKQTQNPVSSLALMGGNILF